MLIFFIFISPALFISHRGLSKKQGPLSVPGFYFMYNIWQDAGIRTLLSIVGLPCLVDLGSVGHQQLDDD